MKIQTTTETTMRKSKFLKHKSSARPKLQRVLIESIKCQTGIDLTKESVRYFKYVDKLVKSRGKDDTIKRLKLIFNLALNSTLHQPLPEVSYLKIDRNGFPHCVRYLKKHLRSPQGIQAMLGLLGYYRAMFASPVPNFSPITDKGKAVDSTLINEIVSSLPPKWKVNLTGMKPVRFRFRARKGPNGQATYTCYQDAVALKRDSHLVDAIIQILELQEEDDLLADFEEIIENVDESAKFLDGNYRPVHSRLAIKREGGGKTRIFAMVDYFTQVTLEPLHSSLAGILQSIPQDCTYHQEKPVEVLKKWTIDSSKDIYCYDLRGASDRIPMALQVKVIEALTKSREYAENWKVLMTDREFSYKGLTYKWAVGQPLGAYSSWPSFTLAHHLMVLCAARRVGVSNPSYYMIGDDICIKGHEVASEYRKIIEGLGIEISHEKSMTGASAEFAKRCYHQGIEISPTPVKMLQALVQDPLLITEACDQIRSRSSDLETFRHLCHSAVWSLAYLLKRDPKQYLLVAANPITGWYRTGAFGIPKGNLRWPVLDQDLIDAIYLIIKYKYIMTQYELLQKNQSVLTERVKAIELPGVTQGPAAALHPFKISILKHIRESGNQAHREVGKFWSKIKIGASTDILPTLEPLSMDVITNSFHKRVKHEARISIELHRACCKARDILYEQEQKGLDTFSKQEVLNTLFRNKTGVDTE